MKNSTHLIALLFGALVFLVSQSSSTLAQPSEPVGLILSTSGTVTAEDSTGNSRRLARRSPVYEGDSVITAANSRAQIRFNDNGLIALQPNSTFVIEEHQFSGQEDGSESASYNLVRGGLQAITGLIGNTNKESYRVETPIATIGLRGTHWAATLCTAACDGNPPGLYGGVADGGVDVCNGGGCTAVDTNTYFYAPNANTRPQLLLAPPTVVFNGDADTEEGDEEQSDEADAEAENADSGGEDAEGGEPATQAPEDTSRFAATSGNAQRAGTRTTNTTVQTDASVETEPLVSESADSISRNTEQVIEEINPRLVSNPQIQLAGSGEVAAFASAIGVDDQSTSTVEAIPLSVNALVIPGGSSNDRIGLTELVSIGTTVTALDFYDQNGVDCQPCLFALAPGVGQSAELQEFASGTLGNANYSIGRWLGDATLSENGSPLNTLDNHHFAYADALTPLLPKPLGPAIAVYTLVDATLPTDGTGITGTLVSATLEVDFYFQEILSLELSMELDTRTVSASLLQPVSLAGAVGVRDLAMTGICTGGACGASGIALSGSSSLAFIGANAEGALGSYSLSDAIELSQTFAGAFVLGFNEEIPSPRFYDGSPAGTAAPSGAVAAFAAMLNDSSAADDQGGPGGITFPVASGTSSENLPISQTITTTTVDGIENVVTAFHYEPGEYDHLDDNTSVIEKVDFAITNSILIEDGVATLGASDQVPANWGLWKSPAGESIFIYPDTLTTGGYHHYAYAESVTPDTFQPAQSATLAYYSLVGGTSPSDLEGNLGDLTSVTMTLDYFRQAITQFDLSATINNTTYMAHLFGSESILEEGWSDLELDLRGVATNPTAGDVAIEGESTLSFVGNTAEGVIGHYSLADESLTIGAYGVYLLEQDLVGANNNFIDLTSGTAPIPTAAMNGTVGTFATTDSGNPWAFMIYPGEVSTEYSYGSPINSYTDYVELVSLNGVNNLISGFGVGFEYDYCCGSSDAWQIQFDLETGLLVESGGIANFAGTGAGVNWGRWYASATIVELYGGSVYDYYYPGENHHFGYYGGTGSDAPLRGDFATPTIASYSWVGGTSPTDEQGRAGIVDFFNVDLDFYNQSILKIELGLEIGERIYRARLLDVSYNDGYIQPRFGSLDGLPFEFIDEIGYIPLIGRCGGGDCGEITGLDEFGRPIGGTLLAGELQMDVIGNQAQGLLGSYGLWSVNDFGCEFFFDCYSGEVIYYEGGSGPHFTAMGTAVLEQISLQDHPRWVVEPTAFNAVTGSVFAAAGAETDLTSTPLSIPFGELLPGELALLTDVPGAGAAISFFDVTAATSGECGPCAANIANAVLSEWGKTPSHPYAGLANDPVEVIWGSWSNRTNYLADASGNTLSSAEYMLFAYSEDLTTSFPANPLPQYSWASPSSIYYFYAGGPSPVNDANQQGFIDWFELAINFELQTIDYFGIGVLFPQENGPDEYWDLYNSGASTSLDPNLSSLAMPLIGYCDYCNGSDNFDAQGFVQLALLGTQAQTVLGSVFGWTEYNYTQGVNAQYEHSMENVFVAHQEFNDHFVQNPVTEIAAAGALAIGTLIDNGGTIEGFSFSGEIGQDGISAALTNVVSTDHDHPNSVASFTTNVSSWGGGSNCASGCSWDLTEGEIQYYDNDNDFSPNDAFDVYWGRWMHQDDVEAGGSTYATNGLTQFAYSPDVTEVVPTSGVLTYHNMDTWPYTGDESGTESYINSIYMAIDFAAQSVTSFDLDVNSYSGGNFIASETGPTLLSGPNATIDLVGTCTGICGTGASVDGSSSITLIGPNAEGALGAYDLSTVGGMYQVSGAFVMEQDVLP